MIHSLLAMSCNVQTPGDGPHLCHSYSVAKILKLTKLPVDLPSYFLQVSRAAVNLVTHRMPPKTAVKIKRLENTQNERTAIPSPLPAHLVGSELFFMTGWFSLFLPRANPPLRWFRRRAAAAWHQRACGRPGCRRARCPGCDLFAARSGLGRQRRWPFRAVGQAAASRFLMHAAGW